MHATAHSFRGTEVQAYVDLQRNFEKYFLPFSVKSCITRNLPKFQVKPQKSQQQKPHCTQPPRDLCLDSVSRQTIRTIFGQMPGLPIKHDSSHSQLDAAFNDHTHTQVTSHQLIFGSREESRSKPEEARHEIYGNGNF